MPAGVQAKIKALIWLQSSVQRNQISNQWTISVSIFWNLMAEFGFNILKLNGQIQFQHSETKWPNSVIRFWNSLGKFGFKILKLIGEFGFKILKLIIFGIRIQLGNFETEPPHRFQFLKLIKVRYQNYLETATPEMDAVRFCFSFKKRFETNFPDFETKFFDF